MRRSPNVYTITPETAFLPALVDALFANRLDLDVDYATNPLKLADLTIYVPTQRAAKILAACFAEKTGHGATFLPRILPLGGFGGDEEPLLENEFDAQRAVPPLERRLLLAQWVLAWGLHLRDAVVSIGADGTRTFVQPGETFTSVANPADAFALSGDLATLIDECLIEGVAFETFGLLGQGTYDDYWRITLEFLKIAFENWPKHLIESELVEAAAQRANLIDREVERIEQGQAHDQVHGQVHDQLNGRVHGRVLGPMIAAGSTGTNEATARLIRAISRAKLGAVVLPGLDLTLDQPSYDLIEADALATHPQAALARLLGRIGIARNDVVELGNPSLRSRFISEALRPARSTQKWHAKADWNDAELAAEFSQITLIEAENEREEALAIAICLREALEDPHTTVALITPERTLAERVSAELARWDIVAEDSAGRSLTRTGAGALALHILNAARTNLNDGQLAAEVLTLLKHPAVSMGRDKNTVALLAHWLEAGVFRQLDLSVTASLSVAVCAAQEQAKSRYAPAFLQALDAADWAEMTAILEELEGALAPLRSDEVASLKMWAQVHKAALQALAGVDLIGRDGASMLALLEELQETHSATLQVSLDDYANLLTQIMGEKTVRYFKPGHPRLAVLGLLEARLIHADVVVLAGLDEKIWPPQARSDALINRGMRAELGLSSPERRLGQTAHDFMLGFCRDRVVLTRAKKRGGEPTVASRFLQRIEAVAGPHVAQARARGDVRLDWARRLDDGEAAMLLRPAPKPPIALRPTGLSVTAIETLRRDPYSIFAGRILKLPVLGPLKPDFSARDLGTKLHAIFDLFVKASPNKALPAAPEKLLLALAAAQFEGVWNLPAFQTFGRAKVERMLRQFLKTDRALRQDVVEIHTEVYGKLSFNLADNSLFTLSATADRADYGKDGSLTLMDYKTGAMPGVDQVIAGFNPQLTLEVEMARRNAFNLPKAAVIKALYLKFGGREDAVERSPQGSKGGDLMDLARLHFDDLLGLLDQFRDPATAYHARPFPTFVGERLDYDHLSRFKEWSSLGSSDEGDE